MRPTARMPPRRAAVNWGTPRREDGLGRTWLHVARDRGGWSSYRKPREADPSDGGDLFRCVLVEGLEGGRAVSLRHARRGARAATPATGGSARERDVGTRAPGQARPGARRRVP